jgi:Fe-S cluster biogenesis protein NfuA
VKEKIEAALDSIRPALQNDGCPMSAMTLKMGIERVIKQQVPEIKEVVSVE